MNLSEINKKRAELKTKLDELEKEAAKKTSKFAVICESNNYGNGCGYGFYIQDLEYVQTHWYESPHGCTGGDNWHKGEGQFICPKCGHRNRLINRQDVEDLKYKFRSIKNEYKE
jgi:hypothetical protein